MGHFRKLALMTEISALPSEAGIVRRQRDVRKEPGADKGQCPSRRHVCTSKAGLGGRQALFRLGSFARDPPCRIRRHRPRCRPQYLYLDRDQSAPSTQSPPQAARAYGAHHRTGEGTCHRERPLASIDVMSPRVAGPPWRSVDSSGLSVSRRRYSRATDPQAWV